jgi:hypothetical protein
LHVEGRPQFLHLAEDSVHMALLRVVCRRRSRAWSSSSTGALPKQSSLSFELAEIMDKCA